MTAEAAVPRWIEAWTVGWREHDAHVIAAVYADDAIFVSEPFREAQRPADYAEWAFADEAAVEFWFGEPIVGDARAAIPYWAIIRGHDDSETTIAGAAHVRFGPDGRVVEQRDYWSQHDGALTPPAGWGPAIAHARRD